MAKLNFPSSPTVGTEYTPPGGSRTWVYNGSRWRLKNNGFKASLGIPLSGNSSTNGYAFGTDGDTGLFSPIVGGGPNNGTLGLFTNNQERIRIASNGRIGIGTSSPTTVLTISANSPIITLKDDSTGTGAIGCIKMEDSVGEMGLIGFDSTADNDLTIKNRAFGGIDITTTASNTSRVFVASGGNVGIGTKTPNSKLQIVGTTFTNVLCTVSTGGINPTIFGRINLAENSGLQYDNNKTALFLTPPGGMGTTFLVVRPSDAQSSDSASVDRETISATQDQNINGRSVLFPYFKSLQGAAEYRNKFIQGNCTIYIDENTSEDSISTPTNFNKTVLDMGGGIFAACFTPKTSNTNLLQGYASVQSAFEFRGGLGSVTIQGRFLVTTFEGNSRWTTDRKFNSAPPKLGYRVYASTTAANYTIPTSWTDFVNNKAGNVNVRVPYDLGCGLVEISDIPTITMKNICIDVDTNLEVCYPFGASNAEIIFEGVTISLKGPALFDKVIGGGPRIRYVLNRGSLKSPLWKPKESDGTSEGSDRLYPNYGICFHTDGNSNTTRTEINNFIRIENSSILNWNTGGTSIYNDGIKYSRKHFSASIIVSGWWRIKEAYYRIGSGCEMDQACPLAFGTSNTSLTGDSGNAVFLELEDGSTCKIGRSSSTTNEYWSLSGDLGTEPRYPFYITVPLGNDKTSPINDEKRLTDPNSWVVSSTNGNTKFKLRPFFNTSNQEATPIFHDIFTSISGNPNSFSNSTTRSPKDIFCDDQPYNAFQNVGSGNFGLYRFNEAGTWYNLSMF